jgi:hypothetical protein
MFVCVHAQYEREERGERRERAGERERERE